MNWPKYPVIYEINTWVWLNELSRKYHRLLTLTTVPTEEWDAIGRLGVDAVWFMGVWERSPAGRTIAMKNPQLQEDFHRALPDLQPDDVVGSPYCIRRYVVDEGLGGPEGLATARKELAKRNTKLILDLVPNHVAPDHPWVSEHPEYFIRGDKNDLARDPASFFESGGKVFALGRDPFFPAWPDVLQLNAFNSGLRKAVVETLRSIASQADGVRCDMAMLLLNDVFTKTWGDRAGKKPLSEYWTEVITAIKEESPDFLFIAEAYWDLEWKLQQQGFDFCYDKRLYDRLCHESPESVRLHLCADLPYQEKLVRFIENHDEPRAAATFSPEKEQVAAVLTMTLPGARLLHEGQFEGRKIRLPVFLSRRPEEVVQPALRDFYFRLLEMVNHEVFRNGTWHLCERNGWPDNGSFQNLVVSCWDEEVERYLIIINLSDTQSQALVRVPWEYLRNKACQLIDEFSGETYDRNGTDLLNGLYVDLKPWSAQCFRVELTRAKKANSTKTKEAEPSKKAPRQRKAAMASHD